MDNIINQAGGQIRNKKERKKLATIWLLGGKLF